jgi:sulfur-carrier protein
VCNNEGAALGWENAEPSAQWNLTLPRNWGILVVWLWLVAVATLCSRDESFFGRPMDIDVSLFATLQQGRFRRKRLKFPSGSTVADVCRQLAIGPAEVAIRLVNEATVPRDHPLSSGDVVSLFPAIGGG